jgi:hypothetical protein
MIKEWGTLCSSSVRFGQRKKGVPLMDKLTEDCLGYKIMMRPTVNKINFEITPEVKKLSKEHVSNYFNNPEKHWGPKEGGSYSHAKRDKGRTF